MGRLESKLLFKRAASIDLHLHLDGAITSDIARKLAVLQHIDLPTENEEELKKLLTVSEECRDLNEFLECFSLPLKLLQTTAGIREAVRLVSERLSKQDLVYAEIRFAPQLHTERGLTQEDAVHAALEGLKETDLHVNLILCCMRGGEEHKNMETVNLAEKYLVTDGGVVAVDLAGAEGLFPTKDYERLFLKAREAKVPFTIHAGEAAGAESVRDAIAFGASRIGHGVRIIESEEVMNLVKEKGIYLEMCPTSNLQTHAVESLSDYPLLTYMEAGIQVTVNTDDPGIEGTNLTREFSLLEENGLTGTQEQKLLENAIEAAFTSEEVKKELRKELLATD